VQVRVQVAAEDGGPGVHSLFRWLSQDPDVTPVELRLVGHDDQGALGALEVIDVVVSNVIALSSLLVAIATWRGARSPAAVTRIEHNGVSVHLASADTQDIERVLRQLTQGTEPAAPTEEDSPAPDGEAGRQAATQ
jgi:hypothetical protein